MRVSHWCALSSSLIVKGQSRGTTKVGPDVKHSLEMGVMRGKGEAGANTYGKSNIGVDIQHMKKFADTTLVINDS